jgi:hypothetical protein
MPVLFASLAAASMLLAWAGCRSKDPDDLPPVFGSSDDLSYFPPGHEFKLMQEAEELQRKKSEQDRTAEVDQAP